MSFTSGLWIVAASLALFLCVIDSWAEGDTENVGKGTERHFKHFRARRNLYESQRQSDLMFAQEFFASSVQQSLESLIRTQPRTLLIHTRLQGENDTLIVVRENSVVTTRSIQAPTFYNLEVISHLPVTVASILLPNVAASNDTSVNTLDGDTTIRLLNFREVLRNVSRVINEGEVFSDANQISRGNQIVTHVSQLVDDSLDSGSVTMNRLSQFGQVVGPQLRDSAKDAVTDYLICLNDVIQDLGVNSGSNVSVVVAVHPFVYPGSFVVQYYEQLFNVSFNNGDDPDRIILQPSQADEQSQCSANYTAELDTAEPSVCAFSDASLQHQISEIFNGSADTPVHDLLSQAAEELICSENLTFPTCPTNQQNGNPPVLLIGFQTRLERGYIILIIFFASVAIAMGIVVVCIFYEDRVMKGERMSMREKLHSKFKGPHLFSPVNKTTSEVDSLELKSTDLSVAESEVPSLNGSDTLQLLSRSDASEQSDL